MGSMTSKAFLTLVTLLFIVSPLFIAPSIGGQGLNVPINSTVWIAICWVIASGLYTSLNSRHVKFDKTIGLFLFLVTFMGSIFVIQAENYYGNNLFARYASIFFGALFLCALLQFKLGQRGEDNALLIIVLSGIVLAVVTHLQPVFRYYLFDYVPHSFRLPSTGVFQQKNNNAIYLVTTLLIGLYLYTRPLFKAVWSLRSLALLAGLILPASVIISSGSRAGLVALVVGVGLILFSRRRFLSKAKLAGVALMFLMSFSVAGLGGMYKVIDKSSDENIYSEARTHIYQISWQLIKDKPVFGHGIGSFQYVWSQKSAIYADQHPEFSDRLVYYTKHPHNELLYWAIESGLLIPLLMLVLCCYVVYRAISLGSQRGGAYLAIWSPICLHLMVELPFYTSALHWALWLFVVFLIIRHQTLTVTFAMSRMAKMTASGGLIAVTLLSTVLLIHSYAAQIDLFRFMSASSEPPYLQTALNNYYFSDLATEIAMRSKLHNGLESQNQTYVKAYLDWLSEQSFPVRIHLIDDVIRVKEQNLFVTESCQLLLKAKSFYPNYSALREQC